MSAVLKIAAGLGFGLVLAACSMLSPTPAPATAPPSPVAVATPVPEPTREPIATPGETISIGCFLAVHEVIADVRDIGFQVHEQPLSEQRDLLGWYAESLETHVMSAPPDCFSAEEVAAHRELWRYLSDTPARKMRGGRVESLMTATGLPHPTFNP